MIFFDTIVKRVANFSNQSYENNKSDIINFYKHNELFRLSILTSSRSLYEDIEKGKSEKTLDSLRNYFFRAHFNPIPFGVFNSVGVLKWGDYNSIFKSGILKLNVTYDNFFISKNQIIGNDDNWLTKKYCLNPSINILNDSKVFFYKSTFQEKDKIEFKRVEIDFDENLKWLIGWFENNNDINCLIKELTLEGFQSKDIEEYICEIIDVGLIIDDFLFNCYVSKLSIIDKKYPSKLIEKKTFELSNNLDILNFTNDYVIEQDIFFKQNIDRKISHAINTFDVEKGVIDFKIQKKLQNYINFTIKYNIQNTPFNQKINKFANFFSDRYGDNLVPIHEVFNPNSGLNYTSIDIDFKINLHEEILKKIMSSNEKSLILDLEYSDDTQIKQKKIPATFSIFIEVLICKDTGDKVLYIKQLGEASALNLLARFNGITDEICDEIVEYEKQVHYDKITADIDCLVNFRTVNITPSKQFYNYCIPINSSYSESLNPIFLSDLYLHVNDGTLSLVSKNKLKQVLPKKNSAVNGRLLNDNIYRLLCDMEFINQEIYSVNFDFNAYNHLKTFIPRVYLEKNVLLHPAQILLINDHTNDEDLKKDLLEKIRKFDFTKKVVIPDIKGSLTIDPECNKDIAILHLKMKGKKIIYVSECLPELFLPDLSNGVENFSHELIVSVKNEHYQRKSNTYSDSDFSFQDCSNIPVVSEWLYLELFCNSYADNTVLKFVYEKVIKEKKCDQFFFVHYANPERHLRLRFKTSQFENKLYIINQINDLKINNIISKYSVLQYMPEVKRYGGIEIMKLSESLFDLDSCDFLLKVVDYDPDDDEVRIISILKIIIYLKFMNFNLEEMILHCENSIKNFHQEFGLSPSLKKEFNGEYNRLRTKLEGFKYDNFLNNQSLQNDYLDKLKVKNINLFSQVWLLIHMSMNRHFNERQRFNEYKSYYFTKLYLNKFKFSKKHN